MINTIMIAHGATYSTRPGNISCKGHVEAGLVIVIRRLIFRLMHYKGNYDSVSLEIRCLFGSLRRWSTVVERA